jgi:non-ribosomal peptide synthetase component F
LLATSLRRDLPVCVLVGHGALQAAAILGVLKAGRAYVGIDPLHEPDAHRRTLAHCGADVVLCEAGSLALAARLAGPGVQVVDVDAPAAAARAADPVVARSPDDPAYIYYTSGTTGVPKGVLDNQRNVLHNVMRYTNNLGIAPSDRLSLLQSVAFSGAVSSLFAGLLNGATSVPADLRAEGVEGAAEWLEAQGVTIYHSVPSIFERLLGTGRRFASLRVVRLEGDLATPRHVALLRSHCGPGVTLVNGLGATETGISHQFVCGHDTRLAGSVVPVGRPCPDMRGYVVDAAGAALPAGSVGEVRAGSARLNTI